MTSQVGSIIKKCTRKDNDIVNVLSWVTHERWQSNLENTNCNYYLLQNGNGCKGDWRRDYSELPNNTIVLPPFQQSPLEVIPPYVDIDVVFSQHKFGQWQGANQLANYFQCAHVHNEHTMVTNQQLRDAVPELRKMSAHINVFISDFSRRDWGYDETNSEVIQHGINTNIFKPTKGNKGNYVLNINNDIQNRSEILGWDIIQRVIISNNIPFKLVGDNKGLSQPARNVYDLVNEINSCRLFVNCSRTSPIPMIVLECLACGVPVVSTKNCMLPEVIEDGFNGYLTNDEKEMKEHIIRLLNSPDECERLGNNARKRILEQFPLDRFVSAWNDVFQRAANMRI